MHEQDPHRRAVRYRLDRLAEQDRRDTGAGDGGAGDGGSVGDRGGARVGGGARAAGAVAGPTGTTPSTDPGAASTSASPPLPRPPSMAARTSFADELVRQAMARGEFDDLPLTGKPIPGLTGRHDPDWWLKALIEREQITGVLPEALQLRKDDAALADRLDQERTEERVRELVEELNARVVAARRQLLGGPPVVTPLRDVEAEVAGWHERRRARRTEAALREREEARAVLAEQRAVTRPRRGLRGWLRGRTAARATTFGDGPPHTGASGGGAPDRRSSGGGVPRGDET